MISQLERFAAKSFDAGYGDHWQISVRLGSRTTGGEFSDTVSCEFFQNAMMKLRSYPDWDGIMVDEDVVVTLWEYKGGLGRTTHGAHLLTSSMVVDEPMNVVCAAGCDDAPYVFRAEVQNVAEFPQVAKILSTVHGVNRTEFRFKEYSIVAESNEEDYRLSVVLRQPNEYLRRVGTERVQRRAAFSLATKINGLYDHGGRLK